MFGKIVYYQSQWGCWWIWIQTVLTKWWRLIIGQGVSWEAVPSSLGVQLEDVEYAEIHPGRCGIPECMEPLSLFMGLQENRPLLNTLERGSVSPKFPFSFGNLASIILQLKTLWLKWIFWVHTDRNTQPFRKCGCSQTVFSF